MSSVKQIWRANQVAECMQKESTCFYSPCFQALVGFISVKRQKSIAVVHTSACSNSMPGWAFVVCAILSKAHCIRGPPVLRQRVVLRSIYDVCCTE